MAEREYYDDGYHPEDPLGSPLPPPATQIGAVRAVDDQAPRPQSRESEPWWWDYNNGSPPSAPLGGGMKGWNWDGTRWWQVDTPGIGGTRNTTPPPTGGDDRRDTSAPPAAPSVPGLPALAPQALSVPSASLPADIAGLFTTAPPQTPIQSAYQDALLKFMGQSQQMPTLDDPTLQPQVEVYRASQQRTQERNRRQAAERAAATGQSESGYLDNLINKGLQEQSFNTAAFNAGLLGTELTRRREELQAALQLARATGDSEAARELQTRLAQASAAMQQQGLNLQGQLGGGDLSLRLTQTLLGNDQFYDSLGVNTALNLEGLNQRALQTILGGL